MYRALCQVLAELPPATRVYCGHEYTVANLKFAQLVQPHNAAVKAKLAWAEQVRAKGGVTVPSTIGEELTYNPFMRVGESEVQEYAGTAGDKVATMGVIRTKKDAFKA